MPDTSDEETPLLGEMIPKEEKKPCLKGPTSGKLGPIGFSKKGDNTEIVSIGRKRRGVC